MELSALAGPVRAVDPAFFGAGKDGEDAPESRGGVDVSHIQTASPK